MAATPAALLPNNVEAEEAVLGSILIGAWQPNFAAADDYILFLKPADFYRQRNAWVFQAMRTLLSHGWPVDQITTAHQLRNQLENQEHLTDIVDPSYLSYLISRVPTPLHIVHYAKIVKEMSNRRGLLEEAGRLAAEGYGGRATASPSPHATSFDL